MLHTSEIRKSETNEEENCKCKCEMCLRVESQDENINVFYPVCWAQYLRIIPMVNFCSTKRQDKKDKVDSNYAAININDVVKLSVL